LDFGYRKRFRDKLKIFQKKLVELKRMITFAPAKEGIDDCGLLKEVVIGYNFFSC
jgi:hypothetical protein